MDVENTRLLTGPLTASLRRYQTFGARYLILQERALLGDDMGLGKTVQVLAAMSHLHALGARHFLVVAPNSVIINWCREVEKHTEMSPVLLHGPERDERLANSYINVISISGVSNAPNLLDVHFRLLTTDLRILVVADNTSKTDLAERWLYTMQQIRAGESPSKIAKDLRAYAYRLKKQGWYEQRRMIELLAEATERDLVDRLRMSGHTYADIEMALEPRLFNLDKDWLDLEAEFNDFKTDVKSTGKNFKDFLFLIYGVRINEKSIKSALSKTDRAPAGIKLVIDDIVTNAFRTGLDQF
jgi:SNF2 family DNA or RNA helicase